MNIDVEDSYIRISAERKDTFKDNIVTKIYEFTVGLPKNVDKENISAHYEQGVLNLTLQKSAEDKSKKKISVSTGEKPKAWNDFLNFNKKKDDSKVDANKKTN
ncbi:MAG: Hsp20 family protein [Rhizobacter sp.]|nr:Hsp20 family protein [Bacteriovorax sp.]